MLICLWFTFAVLQVSCENKYTTTHSTQFMVRVDEGSVLYLYTKFEADILIRSKVMIGVPKFGNWVTWLGYAHLGFVLWSIRRSGQSSVPVPNLMRIALFVRKLYRVTWPRPCPLWGRFMIRTQGGSVLYVHTKFEADRSNHSRVIKGSYNFEIGSRDPKRRPFWSWNVEFA